MVAQSLLHSRRYLGARFRYLWAKLGAVKAVKSVARVLDCLFYRRLTQGQAWVGRGSVEFKRRRQQRGFAALERKARDSEMRLIPTA